MFTVIICDEHIIKDCCKKYHMYLKPFFKDGDFAFCQWNSSADSLSEAVPELENLIRHKKEWRAFIVNDSSTWGFDAVNKRNPFNYVDSLNDDYKLGTYEKIKAYRADKASKINAAINNPLTKLSIWLCGTHLNTEPQVCYADERDIIDFPESEAVYYKTIDKMGLRPAEVEIDWCRAMKYDALRNNFELDGELFNPPQSIVAISERTKNADSELAELAWKTHTEFEYSQFYADNLYPEKLRYLIYDVSYIKKRRNESAYFNFLTAILLIATQETPSSILRSNRVYKLDMQIDAERVKKLCNDYNSKLVATLYRIDELSKKIKNQSVQPVDSETAQKTFESKVTVPIPIVNLDTRDNLEAKYKGIGLSTDCPQDEYSYWNEQYHDINKYFIRFLREPRRVVKKAVAPHGAFKSLNKIEDERALQLDEFQKEDVMCILTEEEQNMVKTKTAQLFDTAEYTSKMKDADKVIRRGIGQRMTRKTTVLVGVIAALAYLIGFLPFVFSNTNTSESFLVALEVTGIALAIFLLIGFIYLFVLRKKLINRFKHFNYVMSGILKEIEQGVEKASEYLSHAANVMREFSVLNWTESSHKNKNYILMNHKRIITEKISEVSELFAPYMDIDDVRLDYDADSYSYDFTVMANYEYEMPYTDTEHEIDFLQTDNKVNVPVDYIDTVKLTREEFYE